MKYQTIKNLLGKISDNVPRFLTKKWIDVYDQSGTADNRYKSSKQIRFKTTMLRINFCDYSDAYIVVTRRNIATVPENDAYDKKLALKKSAPLIDNAEDFDFVIPMYNWIEYSENYRRTRGSL